MLYKRNFKEKLFSFKKMKTQLAFYFLLTFRIDMVWSPPPIRPKSLPSIIRTLETPLIEERTSQQSSSSSSGTSLTADPALVERNIEISQNIEGENVMRKTNYMTTAAKQTSIIAISAAMTYAAMNYLNNSLTAEQTSETKLNITSMKEYEI